MFAGPNGSLVAYLLLCMLITCSVSGVTIICCIGYSLHVLPVSNEIAKFEWSIFGPFLQIEAWK